MLEDFMTETTVVPHVSAKRSPGEKERRIGAKELVNGSNTVLHAANVMKLSILHSFLCPFHPRSCSPLLVHDLIVRNHISLHSPIAQYTKKKKENLIPTPYHRKLVELSFVGRALAPNRLVPHWLPS